MDKFKDFVIGALSIGIWLILPLAVIPFVLNGGNDSKTEPTTQTVEATETLTPAESDYVRNNGTSDCTSDCSGHDAGYEWAESHDICDPEYDNGNSDSFNEGVQAYAYDNCYYGDGDQPF